MFNSRDFKTVSWNLLDGGELVRQEEGVSLYRVDGFDCDEFIVIRSFGRNGGSGTRVVHEGEDRTESDRVFDLHLIEQRRLNTDSKFTIVTNGS